MGNISEAVVHAGAYKTPGPERPVAGAGSTPDLLPSPEHPVIISAAGQIRAQFSEIIGDLAEKGILPLGPYRDDGIIFIQTGSYTTPDGETGAKMIVIDTRAKNPDGIIKTAKVHETGNDGRWNFADAKLTPAQDKQVIRRCVPLLGKLFRLLTINAIKAEQGGDTETLRKIRNALATKEYSEDKLNRILSNAIEWLIPPPVET